MSPATSTAYPLNFLLLLCLECPRALLKLLVLGLDEVIPVSISTVLDSSESGSHALQLGQSILCHCRLKEDAGPKRALSVFFFSCVRACDIADTCSASARSCMYGALLARGLGVLASQYR